MLIMYLRIPLFVRNNVVRRRPENKHLHYFLVYPFRYDPNRRSIAEAGYAKKCMSDSLLRILPQKRRRRENSTIPDSFLSKTKTSATASLFSSSSSSSSSSASISTLALSTSSPAGKKKTKKKRKTQYTIDDSICKPTNTKKLELIVHKACRSFDIYLEKKPMMRQTRQAFARLVEMIEAGTHSSSFYHGIVLDRYAYIIIIIISFQ